MLMFVIFGAVLLLMLLGVSTAVTMGFASIATFLFAGGDPARLFLVPQRMFAQVSGITLMSIPFFLLMGNLMTVGGVSKSLFGFGRVCLGHRWGGLSNAAIVACVVMAAMELVRTRGHFVVDVITDRVAGTNFGHCCRLAVTVIELVTYALICWYGVVWVLRAQATFQSIPWLQVRWAYAAIPVSAFFMTIYGVRDLILAVRAFLPAKPA